MNYVKHFNINGIDTKQVACIELNGRPNAATEGAVGVLGIDVSSPSHEVYRCVAVNGATYEWELLSSGMSILSATITGGGSQTKVFPYSNILIPESYLQKKGDLILDSEGYLYQISALDSTSCTAQFTGTQLTGGTGEGQAYTLGVSNGELQLLTADGTVADSEDCLLLPDDETITRTADGKAHVIGVKTIGDDMVQIFTGTREEYNELPNKEGVIAFTAKNPGVLDFDADLGKKVQGVLDIMGNPTIGTEGFKFTFDSNYDGYAISGCPLGAEDLVLPSEYEGLPVVSISQLVEDLSDSREYRTVKRIRIPTSVKRIIGGAFDNLSGLTHLHIPDGVIEIWTGATPSLLEFITIPMSVRTMQSRAIASNSNTTIYCEATSKPKGWADDWLSGSGNVVWGFPIHELDAKIAERAIKADTAVQADSLKILWKLYSSESILTAGTYMVFVRETANSAVVTYLLVVGNSEGANYSSAAYDGSYCTYDGRNTGPKLLFHRSGGAQWYPSVAYYREI